MSRHIPEFYKGNYYHIYNRGANKNPIFFEETNYRFLLKRLKKYTGKFSISMIAYCLMPNHYHFLMRQDADHTIGKCIQSVFNSYTKAINKRYNRTGTLFEGPYRAIHIDDQYYLLYLCRYIHRNPLEANLVKYPEEWVYSNYLEWVDKRSGNLFNKEFQEDFFSDKLRYAEFVTGNNNVPELGKYLFN